MSTYLTRMRANAFGMPMLDDYGMDALPERFEPDPSDDYTQRQIMALLDMEAPAKCAQPQPVTQELDEVVDALVEVLRKADVIAPVAVMAVLDMEAPAKQRHLVTEGASLPISREPDFYDADLAWWVGEYGAVGYAVEHYAKAASVLADHGAKVRAGVLPSEYGFTVTPYGDTWQAGLGKCNHAYTLWTIAADAVEAHS